MKRFLVALLFWFTPLLSAQADLQQLLQLVDYVGVDYTSAVDKGAVVNEAEYNEMRDFTAGIRQQAGALPDSPAKVSILRQAERLAGLVEQRVDAHEIQALTADMRLALISAYHLPVVPRKVPDLNRASALFAEQCAACHGLGGRGDGPLARGMEPPPTNFRDAERYAQRTLYGLYSTITQGVPDTAMKGFSQLSDQDRWSLAFYVGSLAASQTLRERGELLVGKKSAATDLIDLKKLTVTTPAEAVQQYGADGAALMAYLRAQPRHLFGSRTPLAFARTRLDESLAAYRRGEKEIAYQLAVQAYLEGFELVEQGLDAVDAGLRRQVEEAMTGLRNELRKGRPVSEIETRIAHIDNLLDLAADRLEGRSLSGGAAFASAFFILVREGLEALLVVAALAAFLVKTGRRDGLRYLHAGWMGALAAGFLTWLASVSLIEISGASREITEGVAALTAAAVLFYVGFWLHDKTHAAQWKRFIEDNIRKALTAGTLWGLAALSFIAVYREVFETILFYQALWVQTDAAGKSMAVTGLGAGAGVLAVLAWLVMRFSVRLPLRQFFAGTGFLMFVLAIVFAGKGVAALQEAGYLPITPVAFPRIELFGIYPNLQGLLLQGALLLLALVLWYGLPGKRRAVASS